MIDREIRTSLAEAKAFIYDKWMKQQYIINNLRGYNYFLGGDTVRNYYNNDTPPEKKKITVYVTRLLDARDAMAFDNHMDLAGMTATHNKPHKVFFKRWVSEFVDVYTIKQNNRQSLCNLLPFMHVKSSVEIGESLSSSRLFITPISAECLHKKLIIADKNLKYYGPTHTGTYIKNLKEDGWKVAKAGSSSTLIDEYLLTHQNEVV